MSMINYASREINCKIVYYGTGLGGKTTNLEYIYSRVNPDTKGKMISLATETERTLFFDFLPIDLGEIRGFKTRFHLYTVPGQVYYNASRRLILKGVDGIVFVADSQATRAEANIESMHNLYENLETYGYDLADDSLRDPVQQTGHAERSRRRGASGPDQSHGGARLRRGGDRGEGRLRDALRVSKLVVKSLS